ARVTDSMHTDHLPVVHHQSSVNETLLVMTSGRLVLALVVDDDGKVVGIFTDEDLRCKLAEHTNLTVEIQTLMPKTPKSVDQQMRASDALSLMNDNAISQLLVLKDRQLIGVISIHDILKAGITSFSIHLN
ncbi:CBS domain-containing protein, partial [Moraxella catarrhalis]|uniref:CBS domain-containing protein n=1 Tax=Moraxella catarrhalis TaxID=480 RepID=UPI00128BB1C7